MSAPLSDTNSMVTANNAIDLRLKADEEIIHRLGALYDEYRRKYKAQCETELRDLEKLAKVAQEQGQDLEYIELLAEQEELKAELGGL